MSIIFLNLLLLLVTPVFAFQESAKLVAEGKESTTSQIANQLANPMLPIPVRRIVMYNTGVSHIQHFGTCSGTGSMEFRFKNKDIDDVLKSMIFFDEKNGRIDAVQYQPAPTTQDLAAEEFSQPMTLAQVLQVHRGVVVEVRLGREQEEEPLITGTIWGVENRTKGAETIETMILVDKGQWLSFAIDELSGIRFIDLEVQQHLQKAMAGIAAGRGLDNDKTVKLLLEGEGERNVGFAYVIDSSVWRSTYRLEIGSGQASLQGWAHVDNITGRDWQDVQLELRSGRPEVFHVDLFSPWLAVRSSVSQSVFDLPPSLDLIQPFLTGLDTNSVIFDPDDEGYGGGGYGGGGGGGFGFGGGGGMGFGGMGFGGMGFGGMPGPSHAETSTPAYSPALGEDVRENWQKRLLQTASSTTQRASQMVQYRIDKPVSLQSGQSAALPILNQTLPIDLFTKFELPEIENGSKQTFSTGLKTIELTNAGQFALMGGPVAVFHNGDFVGDATLEKLELKDKSEIGYAVDRSVSVELAQSDLYVRPTRYQWRGQSLEITSSNQLHRMVTVINKDSEQRKVRFSLPTKELSHWREPKLEPESLEYDAIDAEDFVESYEVTLEAQSEKEFAIVTTGKTFEKKSISGFSETELGHLLGDTELSLDELTRQKLTEYLRLTDKLKGLVRTNSQLNQKYAAVQNRIGNLQRTISTLKIDPVAAEPFVQELVEAAKNEAEISNQQLESREAVDEAEFELARLMGRD